MATHSDYWRERELENIDWQIKNDARISERLRKNYSNALRDIKVQINDFYERYGGKEGLTISDAKKLISKTDVEDYKDLAAQYVKEKNFTSKANREMRLYNVTMRVNRLEYLQKKIELELLAMSSNEEHILKDEFMENALREYERQSGILGITLSDNEKNINRIINSSFHNAHWSDRLWDNQDALRSELNRLLNRGVVQGLNSRDLARQLRDKFDTSTYASERLMRTEMARVMQDVFQDSMKQAEIDEYEYIAEASACDICAELDGKIFEVKEAQPGVNAYPMHPHCKCSQAAYFDRDAWEKEMDERGLRVDADKSNDNDDKIKFTDSVKGNMTKEEYETLENLVNQAPKEVRDLWKKHQDELITVDAHSKKSYYYHDTGVFFNYDEDSRNESRKQKGSKNFSTFFHEYGHHFDDLYGYDDVIVKKLSNSKSFEINTWSYKSKKLGLSGSLKKEIKETMKEFGAKNMRDFTRELQTYAQENYPYGYAGVSDILSGLTKNKNHMGWKHPTKYWKDGEDVDVLGREAFANMFESYAMQGDSDAFMEKVFPKSYGIFIDFLKEASK